MSHPFRVETQARVETTMGLARQRAQAGEPEGLCIVAGEQTAGRGRRGRSWYSPPGGGLYLTLLLRPTRPEVQTLGLVTALALHDALSRWTPDRLKLKWPNDLVIGERKLAGILLEAFEPGPVVLVGIGVNLLEHSVSRLGSGFEDLSEIYLGLHDLVEEDKRPSRDELLDRFLDAFSNRYRLWGERGFAPLAPDWAQRDVLAGRRVRVHPGGESFEGGAAGIDEFGCLLVHVSGETSPRRIVAGEVERVRRVAGRSDSP